MRSRADALDPASLGVLVRSFYDRVRRDALLGPIFERHIGVGAEAWEPHLERMTAFWQTMLLQQPGYRGDPLARHQGIEGLRSAHFDRWLELFDETAGELYDAQTAAFVVGRARTMRAHLSKHLLAGGGSGGGAP